MIFFDGDQTLWDFQALMRRTLAATIEELRRHEPTIGGDLSVGAFVADREATASQLQGKVTNLESIRLAAFTRSLVRLGIADAKLAEHLNSYYLQRRSATRSPTTSSLPSSPAGKESGSTATKGIFPRASARTRFSPACMSYRR